MNVTRKAFTVMLGTTAAGFALRARQGAAQVLSPATTSDLGHQGVLYRVQFPPVYDSPPVHCMVAVLPRESFAAQIIESHDRRSVTTVRDAARAAHARVAINGGFFNGAFAPEGLLVVDGKIVGRKRADWDGTFVVDYAGTPSVTTKPDLRTARYVVQGHPTLVERGAKMGIRSEDHVRGRRTVVAQSGDAILAMVTSPVSLYQLAYLLLEYPDAFYAHDIDVALNLTGDATAGFYAKLPGGTEIEERSYWPNRDVIVFTERP